MLYMQLNKHLYIKLMVLIFPEIIIDLMNLPMLQSGSKICCTNEYSWLLLDRNVAFILFWKLQKASTVGGQRAYKQRSRNIF